MPIVLPNDLRARLISEDAWLTSETPVSAIQSPFRAFLSTLWRAVEGLHATVSVPVVFAVLRSPRAAVQIRRLPGEPACITITDTLTRAIDAYARAWVGYHSEQSLDSGAPTKAQADAFAAIRSMAWSYRHRGLLIACQVPLDKNAASEAVNHAAAALIFLLAHELAHLGEDDARPAVSPAECLTVTSILEREFEADQVAARFLLAEPLHATSIRMLFELLELLEFGVPSAAETHPLAISRLVRVLAVTDVNARARLLRDLQSGRDGFWFLRHASSTDGSGSTGSL